MRALQLPSIAQQAMPDKPRREARQRGISAKRKKAVSATQQMRCSCLACLLCDVVQLPMRLCGVKVSIAQRCAAVMSERHQVGHSPVQVSAPRKNACIRSQGGQERLACCATLSWLL